MKEGGTFMEKRADNVYYLEFVVTDPKIVPKQPERFDAYKGEDRFTTVYRYRNQYITKQRNIKAIDIDRITIHYPCAEAFIEDLFEQKEKNYFHYSAITPVIHFYKYRQGKYLREQRFDLIYRDESIEQILHVLMHYQRETLYTDIPEYREYCDRFEKWVTDPKFINTLITQRYVGKKMAKALKTYNGTSDSLYWAKQYLRNYHVLRGVHCGARKYFKELREEQEDYRQDWISQKQRQREEEDKLFSSMDYFEQLRYQGKMGELQRSILDGSFTFDGIPLQDDSCAEHISRLLKEYNSLISMEDKKRVYDRLIQTLDTTNDARFATLKEIALKEPEKLSRYPVKEISVKDAVTSRIHQIQAIQNEEEKMMLLDEIIGILEMATTPSENKRKYHI